MRLPAKEYSEMDTIYRVKAVKSKKPLTNQKFILLIDDAIFFTSLMLYSPTIIVTYHTHNELLRIEGGICKFDSLLKQIKIT